MLFHFTTECFWSSQDIISVRIPCLPSCGHGRFPAVVLSPSLTHILPAFPLCPSASPWPPVIQGNWSSHQTCDHCCGFVPAPGSYYEVWLVAAAPTELADWQRCPPTPTPPPPPVVPLNSPILSPQNVGATLISELPRCLDKLSVSAERFGRCPQCSDGWMRNKL